MIKAYPPADVEDKIRKLAAAAGQPVTQFLNPFLAEIAAGQIRMRPQSLGPPPREVEVAPARAA